MFGWFYATSLKKPKSITRQTPGCFASRSLVNMPFRKMETFFSEKNLFSFLKIEIHKRSVFFGELLLKEKKSLWKGIITWKQSTVDVMIRYQVCFLVLHFYSTKFFLSLASYGQFTLYSSGTISEGKYFSVSLMVSQCWAR